MKRNERRTKRSNGKAILIEQYSTIYKVYLSILLGVYHASQSPQSRSQKSLPRSSCWWSKQCASWLGEPEAEALDHDRRSPGVEWRNLETDGRVAGAKGVGVASRGQWWGRVSLLRSGDRRSGDRRDGGEGRQSFKIGDEPRRPRPMLDVH